MFWSSTDVYFTSGRQHAIFLNRHFQASKGPVTLGYGLTRSHAEGKKATHRESASVSIRKRRQAFVIVHFQAITGSLLAATASIRRLPRINFLLKNSWPSVAVRGSPTIRKSA